MKTSRRPATAADLTVGTIVYRGKGKVAYRVMGTDRLADGVVHASQTTTKPGTRPTWFYVAELTVDAEIPTDKEN